MSIDISFIHFHLRAQILSINGHACGVCSAAQQRTGSSSLAVLHIIWFWVQCVGIKRQLFYMFPPIQMGLSLPFSWVAEVA